MIEGDQGDALFTSRCHRLRPPRVLLLNLHLGFAEVYLKLVNEAKAY